VPIIDISNWARFHATRAQSDVAQANLEQTALTVSAQVMMRYYALLGQEGLHQAAQRRQNVACDNFKNVSARAEVGSASALDVARAQSDVAQAQQDVAGALLQVQLSRRALETLTGVAPEPGGALGEVPLSTEAPLPQWLTRVGVSLPPVRQASAQMRVARAGNRAAKWGYLPTLSAKGTERATNASGLNGGHTAIWAVTANLVWHFDLTLPATEKAQTFVLAAANETEASALRAAADRIFQDYAQIEANLAKSAAARSQVAATRLGAQWATEKYAAGIISQLEVSQSARDAFSAEAARIQADTDLLYYRAMLRLDAGMAPDRLEEAP
jgi:outer membrane protein TolC